MCREHWLQVIRHTNPPYRWRLVAVHHRGNRSGGRWGPRIHTWEPDVPGTLIDRSSNMWNRHVLAVSCSISHGYRSGVPVRASYPYMGARCARNIDRRSSDMWNRHVLAVSCSISQGCRSGVPVRASYPHTGSPMCQEHWSQVIRHVKPPCFGG